MSTVTTFLDQSNQLTILISLRDRLDLSLAAMSGFVPSVLAAEVVHAGRDPPTGQGALLKHKMSNPLHQSSCQCRSEE